MFSSNNSSKNNDKEPSTVASRILGFCFAVFLGVILLSIALELLSAIWGWLVLVAAIVAVIWIGFGIYRRWRDGW
jgi:heme/copper-type cytochrome/quinol oxidase subunit 4